MVGMLLPAALAVAALGQVDVRLDRYGVGDRWRTGDIVGIQVTFTSDLTEPTPVRVEWEIPDANGDIAENSRSLVLNPKQPATRWLYGRLPPSRTAMLADDLITLVRVFEERDGRRVRELASRRIKAGDAQSRAVQVSIEDDLVGVIGAGRAGLEGYEVLPILGDRPPSLNTATVIARNIQPRDLPDRWEGLIGYQAIVWAEGSPSALSPEEAEALRTWIRRGGQLVIVLPEAGNPWAIGSNTAHGLSTLLPSTPPKRHEGVRIADLLPVLSKSSTLRNETATTPLQVFDRASLDRGFEPLLAMPCARDSTTGELKPRPDSLDGAIIAIEARIGHGRLTILGVDVDAINARRLQQSDIPQADVFWNRMLGRRGDTPSALEFQAWQDAEPRRLTKDRGSSFSVEGTVVSSRIGLRGQAALGLLGVLALFAIYWAIAAPISWLVLGQMRRRQLAWLVFIGVAAGFTAFAWGASRLLSEREVRLQHVTVLDWVARGPHEPPSDAPRMARANTWFSASLPGYGTARVSIDPGSAERNLVTVWSPPPSGSGTSFPNTSRYEVPIESPGSIQVPSRATSSEFEAQWLGAVDAAWGALPASEGATQLDATFEWIVEPRVGLRGALVHRLPGTLTSVRLIHIQPFRTPPPQLVAPPAPRSGSASAEATPRTPPLEIDPSGDLVNFGRFREVPSWEPGAPLELGSALYPNGPAAPNRGGVDSLSMGLRERYYAKIAASGLLGGVNFSDTEQFDLLHFYWMLQPPEYMVRPEPQVARVLRTFGRGIDLSAWSNRPCLLIIGYLNDSPCPVPIEIEGRRPESRGLTIVRVIVPLPIVENGLQPWP